MKNPAASCEASSIRWGIVKSFANPRSATTKPAYKPTGAAPSGNARTRGFRLGVSYPLSGRFDVNTTVIKVPLALLMISAPAVFLNCQSARALTRGTSPFHYTSATPGTFGFCPPIVTESAIFYNNRYTDQNYHSIDTKRTEDAFFRDLKYVIRNKKLAWVELGDSLAFPIHSAFSFIRTPLDSLPPPIRNKLLSAHIDYAFIVYDLRLTLTQLVGTSGVADSTQTASYGPGIHRELSFKCSIVNVAENKSVYFKEINRKENGTSLDLVEKSIRTLFYEILKE